ncbi:tetratricopeptide repeat-containing sensor histidine kinase [Ancylomarina sp. YFZ004]
MKYSINTYLAFLIFLLSISSTSLFGQNQSVEELAEASFIDISKDIRAKKLDSSYIEIQKLHKISTDNKLPLYIGKAESLYGEYYLKKGDKDSSLYHFELAEKIFESEEDFSMQGKMDVKIAVIYKSIGEIELSIKFYEKSTSLLQINEDTLWYGIVSNKLGRIYYHRLDYVNALKNMQNSINAFRLLDDHSRIGSTYNSMGLIYRETNNKAKEKEVYLKGIEAYKKIDESKDIGVLYNNLSELYLDEGNVALGLETLEKAKTIYEKANYEKGLIGYYSVLAYYHFTLDTPNYEKTIEYSIKKIALSEKFKSYIQYADGIFFLGTSYIHTNQYEKAKTILEEGLDVAEELGYYEEIKNITYPLADVYNKLGMKNKAYYTLEKHIRFRDSISSEEKIQEFTRLDEKFKYDQQILSDSLARVQVDFELRYKHQQEIQEQDRALIIIGFIALFLLGTAIFIFIYARRRKKQAKELDEKNIIINKSLSEKELLLKEIHHRVKNNLQIVSSLLDLQSSTINDEATLVAINDGQTRMKAMALIHQNLYQNKHIESISFKDYIEQLVIQVGEGNKIEQEVEHSIEIEDINFDIDTAVPLGLIVNELLTNAFKYAFSKQHIGQLNIKLEHNQDYYKLSIKDNGKGLPEGYNFDKSKSLGLRLVRRLSKQLYGKAEYTYDNGSVFTIYFKDTVARREIS